MKDVMDFSLINYEEPYKYGIFKRDKWIYQRQAIMAEIIACDPAKRWSARQLAAAMREHPLVSRYHPDYSHNTAWKDYLALRNELKDRRNELAGTYIESQLEISDAIIQDLWNDYNELNLIDPKDLVPEARAQYLADKIEKKDTITRAIERMFKRQAALIPDVEAPKKVDIHSVGVTMTLDQFLEIKKQALGGDVIDGEVVDES